MKKFTLFLFFTSIAFYGYSTKWNVGNSGFTFNPASITIHEGDTVVFTVGGSHTVVEVNQNTWNNNGNTPLSGGFSLPGGGGTLLPAKLPVGTHWYVCGNHFSSGMKGIINVEQSTATKEPGTSLALSLNPNPCTGKFQLTWSGLYSASDYQIDVMDINGKNVYTTKGTGDHGWSQYTEINLSGYPEGTYIVRLRNDDGILTKKLILQ